MSARHFGNQQSVTKYDHYGGFASKDQGQQEKDDGPLYNGPSWFTENLGNIY